MATHQHSNASHIVYISGPMFNPYEQENQQDIAKALEQAGFQTYLPQRDGLVFGNLMDALGETIKKLTMQEVSEYQYYLENAIFALDVFQVIARCDCLVFNMNGSAPDGGSVAETALAFRSGKPIVTYKSDARSLLYGIDNPLVRGLSLSAFNVVTEVCDIPKQLMHALAHWQEQWGSSPQASLPGAVQQWVDIGAIVWAIRQTFTSQMRVKAELDRLVRGLKPLIPAPSSGTPTE